MLTDQQQAKITLEGMAPLLQVYDMPRSLKFYREIIGFKVESSSAEGDEADWVMLKCADITLMLNTAYEKPSRPAAEDDTRREAHKDTILYFGCRDINGAYTYLKDCGVELSEPEITGYGWKAIHFLDPDGYSICFHWPLENPGGNPS